MSYKEEDIKYETKDFFVLAVGKRGFDVYQAGFCFSTRRAQIGHCSELGLSIAKERADKLQKDLDEKH